MEIKQVTELSASTCIDCCCFHYSLLVKALQSSKVSPCTKAYNFFFFSVPVSMSLSFSLPFLYLPFLFFPFLFLFSTSPYLSCFLFIFGSSVTAYLVPSFAIKQGTPKITQPKQNLNMVSIGNIFCWKLSNVNIIDGRHAQQKKKLDLEYMKLSTQCHALFLSKYSSEYELQMFILRTFLHGPSLNYPL